MGAKLNTRFFTGKDHYSDGEIEEELLEIVKENEEFDEILRHDKRWPILYHLSPMRENIVNWYPFKEESSCLEIGAGCGAITGALCDRLKRVVSVELSKRRAEILYERHKARDNLEVIVANLNDIPFEERFDYVTLNGVLEYAASFTKSDDPYGDFLKKIRTLLKPEGELLVAIENRYGLKYFAGAREDHTARMFDGIEGYEGIDFVRTFGKKELEDLLTRTGYPRQTFFYPHPDYKMPLEIFSDERLPSSHTDLMPSPNFDYDRFTLFDETKAFKGIIENGQFPFFANSFLVVCGA